MSKQKSNVFLKTSYNFHAGEQMPCGHWSIAEMDDFLAQVKRTHIPDTACVISLFASMKKFAHIGYRVTSHSEELEIFMNPLRKKCAIRDKKNCPKCIAAGKCHDEFVINLIGKKLFANKYEK